MRCRTLAAPLALVAAALAAAPALTPARADAQILERLKKAAGRAAESEAERQVDRAVRDAIRCAVDDPVCPERAEAAGQDVVYVDDEGEVITDASGAPVASREAAAAAAPPVPPGQGAWANYDFVPGDEILVYDDYSGDRVGDFPRRFQLVQGNWDVVEWQGDRWLRATANGMLAIPLPRTLPERFTLEVPVSVQHGNAYARVLPGRSYYGPARDYKGSVVSVEAARAGVRSRGQGPSSLSPLDRQSRTGVAPAPLRVMADGAHMKVYLGDTRVANVPNAVFPRTDTLFIAVGSASQGQPVMLGPVRIAGGGRDLYDRLERDGRVATQGILFATNSDRIRPESTPTLTEIGEMLAANPELRLRIEGHTDAEGDDAHNQALSERRAAAVKRYLMERHGVADARLETAGLGESRPAAGNETPDGRQQNRRVELVKLP